MGKMARAGVGAGIFDKLEPEPEPEPHKNGPTPQHWSKLQHHMIFFTRSKNVEAHLAKFHENSYRYVPVIDTRYIISQRELSHRVRYW
jgi:hypothetical protein